MLPGPSVPPEMTPHVLRVYAEGASTRSIAKDLGVSSHQVRQLLRACGVVIRSKGEQQAKVSHRRTHGHAAGGRSPEYSSWLAMIARCTRPSHERYDRYGGRGIGICDQWLGSFEAFLADMGQKPSKAHELDRVNNDGNYEPGNCRWAVRKQQARNRRTSLMVKYGDFVRPAIEVAELNCISASTLNGRMWRGWELLEAVTVPPDPRKARGLDPDAPRPCPSQ